MVAWAPDAKPQAALPKGVDSGVGSIFPDRGNLNSPARRLPVYGRTPYFYGSYTDRYRRYYVQADWYQPTPWHAGPYLYSDKQSPRNKPKNRSTIPLQQTPPQHPLLHGITLSPESHRAVRQAIAEHNRAQSQAKTHRQSQIRETWALAKTAKTEGDLKNYKLYLQTLRELSEKPMVTQALVTKLRPLISEDQQEVFAQNTAAILPPASISTPESGDSEIGNDASSATAQDTPSTDTAASETPTVSEP